MSAARKWELSIADAPDGRSESFFPADSPQVETYRKWALEEGGTLVWTTTAKSGNDAMSQMHRYLGRPEYQPMLREDGTPYPEDEDDDYRQTPRPDDRGRS
jgi:hypothetical protein